MTDDTETLAELARDAGIALTTFADATEPPMTHGDRNAPDITRLGLGKRQQEISELAGLNNDEGMRASEIATEIEYDAANTHRAKGAYTQRGIAEELREAAEPSQWRLAPAYRGASNLYLRIAALVRPGEWTTYDDISLAVHGHRSAARAVARAAMLPHFSMPHRMLSPGGRVPAAWRSHKSKSPDPQGLHPSAHRRERPRRRESPRVPGDYVSWDVLTERCEQAR